MGITVRDSGEELGNDGEGRVPQRDPTNRRDANGRFPSGVSGNPNGRPAKRKVVMPDNDNMTDFVMEALLEEFIIKENGKPRKTTLPRLLMMKLKNDVATGTAFFRLQFFKTLNASGYATAITQAQDFIRRMEDLNTPESGWTPEMEEKFQALASEYEEVDEFAEREREEEWEDREAYIEAQRDDYERFRVARRVMRGELPPEDRELRQ